MPSLILTKTPDGSATGARYPLGVDPLLIGRNRDKCEVFLDLNAVSREHAQIVAVNGRYFLEDLKSRNKTYLNNKLVEGRSANPLKNGDNIKICDFLFSYRDEQQVQPGWPSIASAQPDDDDLDKDGHTTIETALARAQANQFLELQPTDKLRILLDISTALSKTHNLDSLLPQIADQLFVAFKQADRCFIIEVDEEKRLRPVVTKLRRPAPENERYSRTIVRKCLETQQAYLSEDASSDSDMKAAQSIAEFKIRSVMCVPLVTQDTKPIGVIQLDSQDRTKKFSAEDLKFLMCVATQAAIAIENVRMHAAIVSQKMIEEENRAAAKVQLGFLPQRAPLLPGYEFFWHYTAARMVGGDYYDFIPLPDGRVAVLLGDVSGKGVPAALLMARLSGEARVAVLTKPDVADAITHLNEQLMQANLEDRYVTLSAAVIDPLDHRVELVSAGHLSPWVYRQQDRTLVKVFEKSTGDFPVGWVPCHRYTAFHVDLEAGDSLIVYTDGIEDAQPASGQRFTEQGVVTAIEAAFATDPGIGARGLGARLVQAVQTHAGNHPQFDDIALVCFGRAKPGAPETPTATRERLAIH